MTEMIIPPTIDDISMKEFDPEISRRLLSFMQPYRSTFLLSLVMMIVGALAGVAGPYLVKVALDSGLAAGSLPALQTAVLLYLVTAIVQWISTYSRVNTMARVAQSIIQDLRMQMFRHLQELSLSFFSRYSVGRVIVRVINDVNVLQDFLTWALLAIVRDVLTLVGILIAMISMDAKLSLISFTVIPLMVIATVIFRKNARQNYRKSRAAMSWVNSVLAENINGVRVVQSFSRQSTNYNFFSRVVNHYNLDINVQVAKIASIFFPTIDFLGYLATAMVIWLGGTAVLGQNITPGVLVAFVLYITRFFEPIRDLSQRFDALQATMASGERILGLLNAPVDIHDEPGAAELPRISGTVEFKDVSFHYPDDEQLVVKGINLKVEPGETVALVGKTGAGKTTLVKLLSRFNDVSAGQVLLDGHDIRQVTQQSLRSQLGIVLQDPFLFSGSVLENIRFGRLDATQAEVEEAARAVGAHDFITQLRSGYNTSVEEGGVMLSVGQRQLISFARALLADPRILILDEATSSVDTQTERLIQQALTRLLHGRTAFVIAHRLSTIVNADRIVVIQDGVIQEEGTHSELLARHGLYFKLYSMRFEEGEES
jgi:ATP-binding cassette, subfamily B, multidrug efflux pump